MPELTFFPLGNADCCRVDLTNKRKLLFDYAATRCEDDESDKRVDLAKLLRDDLNSNRRNHFDVVTFTHLDADHTKGSTEFFYLEHDTAYQGEGRIKIEEMWVPAAVIIEEEETMGEEHLIIQAEARYRLKNKKGIRVFSRPVLLKDWLQKNGVNFEDVAHLITDAGQVVPGFTNEADGVEFFVHSPFAKRLNECEVIDRNSDSIVLQATFTCYGEETKLILGADTTHEEMSDIVDITKWHGRDERLESDVVKLPHHCSYLSLGPEKGTEKTEPAENVRWLYEEKGRRGLKIVSTSDPIQAEDTVQPPHWQAANYYRDLVKSKTGEFLVTMEFPSTSKPEPLVIEITARGATVKKRNMTGGAGIIGGSSPRAG